MSSVGAANHPVMYAVSYATDHAAPVRASMPQTSLPDTPPSLERYRQLYDEFRWAVPEHFNLAEVCCRRWTEKPQRIALYLEDENGTQQTLSYGELSAQANQLSHALHKLGVERGDRVALLCPQTAEVAITHMAVYQLGAIIVPLSHLFGPEALATRLQAASPKVLIAHSSALANVAVVRNKHREALRELKHCITIAGEDEYSLRWQDALVRCPKFFTPVNTKADDPAIFLFTSGTTGAPKGALLPHRVLIGNLPGFVASQNWFPQAHDCFWTPADWAWTGGLMDGLLPTLYFGMPIVGYHGRFSPRAAFSLMARYRVTNTFLFPTALKMMMREVPQPTTEYELHLRGIMSAGEDVGEALSHWVAASFGIPLNAMFGQTEMNYLLGNSGQIWPAKPGSMGLPYPGHVVVLVDDKGRPVKPGEVGEIAVQRQDRHGVPDPIFFLGYWQDAEATSRKYIQSKGAADRPLLCRTGDLAVQDEEGYFWYRGRADDMFKAAGYRIGPAEIENCLLQHPAVANVAVVPSPDAERGNVVKAFIVLSPSYQSHTNKQSKERLVAALQAHVRARLAPYQYPKLIEFINNLPMTATGKVQRKVLRDKELNKSEGKFNAPLTGN